MSFLMSPTCHHEQSLFTVSFHYPYIVPLPYEQRAESREQPSSVTQTRHLLPLSSKTHLPMTFSLPQKKKTLIIQTVSFSETRLLQFLFLVSMGLVLSGPQLRPPRLGLPSHGSGSANQLESFVKDPLDGVFDGLVKHEWQSGHSRESELRERVSQKDVLYTHTVSL